MLGSFLAIVAIPVGIISLASIREALRPRYVPRRPRPDHWTI